MRTRRRVGHRRRWRSPASCRSSAFTSVAFDAAAGHRRPRRRADERDRDRARARAAAGCFAASSTRGKYWREAGRVFEDRPAVGRGRRRLRGRPAAPPHRRRGHAPRARLRARRRSPTSASSGVVLTTLLLLAWLVAALRATGAATRAGCRSRAAADEPRPAPRLGRRADRPRGAARSSPSCSALQSAIDWTWFVPGPAAMALVAAGFVAGRGPLGAAPHGAGRASRTAGRPRARIAAAAGVAARRRSLLAWAIWQPEASDRATGDALALADAGRRYAEAIAKTEDAADTNPLSARAAARAGVDRDPGGRRGGGPRHARAGRAQVPGRPADLVPAGRLPARHARPPAAGARRRSGARSTSTRSRNRRASSSSRRARGCASRDAASASARRASSPSGSRARAASRTRRRSEPTSKPSSSSSAPSERAREARRCGESGSGRTHRAAALAGVVSASRPPGASTRRTSDRKQLDVAHVLDRLGAQHEVEARRRRTAAARPARARPARAAGSRAPRALERHRATRRRASARSASSSAVRRPSPQPRSSARSAGPSPRTNSASSAGGGPGSSGTSSQSSSS